MYQTNRENAYRVLSQILWERKFKKKNTLCVINGGKMNEDEFLKAMEEVKTIKK